MTNQLGSASINRRNFRNQDYRELAVCWNPAPLKVCGIGAIVSVMFRRAALPFGLLALFHTLVVSVLGYAQSFVVVNIQQPKESPISASACLEFSFTGRLDGDEKYSRELGEKLWLRFAPMKDNWGWTISIEPADSTEDYAWPVNPPFHFGNSEYLGTGYGDTVEYQLKHEHRIFFILNRTVYEQAVRLVDDEALSKDSEGAGRYLAALPTIPTGVLYVKPIRFEVVNEGKSVNWMEYSVTVIVPASFQPAADLNPRKLACPPMHWAP
jgi:hypothetical protein